MEKKATVIGAGLAGCEAAWQIAEHGVAVELTDMKPGRRSPAHRSDGFAELVCSNSFRSNELRSAAGLLKEEMRLMHSLILEAADATKVPAGDALAVNRDDFSDYITEKIRNHPLISVIKKEATQIPDTPVVIATGPLTSDRMFEAVSEMSERPLLHVYDASAPVVMTDSVDMDKVFYQSRHKAEGDYLNCPLTKEGYRAFHQALLDAEKVQVRGFEEKRLFEACRPIESMALRSYMEPLCGPLKPDGLIDPRTGKRPFAVVQLRKENAAGTMMNMVGFQTRLTFPEQKRVFGMIPGLENAVYARFGVMHRNTFISSPGFLNAHYETITRPMCFFAGQITGVEGYIESASSGLVAGISLARMLRGGQPLELPGFTATGALGRYVTLPNADYQPMHITFGLIDPMTDGKRYHGKKERYEAVSARSLEYIKGLEL